MSLTHNVITTVADDSGGGDDDDVKTAGVKVVVGGLNVESTSVYWVACPPVCRHAVQLKSLTDVDKSFVASSLPFDGTGHHIIRHVLIVAAHNGTSVRLAPPLSAADDAGSGSTMPGSQNIRLDEFQTVTVQPRVSDLTGLSIEATKPVFVSISLSSKLDQSPTTRTAETDSAPSQSNGSVQDEQILHDALLFRYNELTDRDAEFVVEIQQFSPR